MLIRPSICICVCTVSNRVKQCKQCREIMCWGMMCELRPVMWEQVLNETCDIWKSGYCCQVWFWCRCCRRPETFGWSNGSSTISFLSLSLWLESWWRELLSFTWRLSEDQYCKIYGISVMVWIKFHSVINYVGLWRPYVNLNTSDQYIGMPRKKPVNWFIHCYMLIFSWINKPPALFWTMFFKHSQIAVHFRAS